MENVMPFMLKLSMTVVGHWLWRCAAPLEGDLDATKEVDGVIPSERKDVYESMVLLLPSHKMIP